MCNSDPPKTKIIIAYCLLTGSLNSNINNQLTHILYTRCIIHCILTIKLEKMFFQILAYLKKYSQYIY